MTRAIMTRTILTCAIVTRAIRSRAAIQSALCLLLAPLLVAQQAVGPEPSLYRTQPASVPNQVIIPKGTRIDLVSLEKTTSATATKGAVVRFALAQDLVVNGVTVLYAGTPVDGTVTCVRRGVPNRKWGNLRITVRNIQINPHARLPLRSSDPENRESMVGELAMCFFVAPLWCIPSLVLGAGTGKPNANNAQEVSPPCDHSFLWTASDFRISGRDTAANKAALLASPPVTCNGKGKNPTSPHAQIR